MDMFTVKQINRAKLTRYVTIKETARKLREAYRDAEAPKEVADFCKYAETVREDYVEVKQFKTNTNE